MNFSNLLDAKNMVNLSDWQFSYHLAPCLRKADTRLENANWKLERAGLRLERTED